MLHDNTVLTIRNRDSVTSPVEYVTNLPLYSQLCQPIYLTVRRTKIQNYILELVEVGTLKTCLNSLSFLKYLKVSQTNW